MNLIPSVRAYIAERIRQLERLPGRPYGVISELRSIDTLCAGLDKQAAMFDDLVTAATKRIKRKP